MSGHTLDSRLDGALGGKTASALQRAFGMKTVGDLLAHYPRRYALRGELTPISSLPIGEPVTIVAEVRRATERRMQNRKGSILEVLISDGQGDLSLTFFNQSWRIKELQPGRRGIDGDGEVRICLGIEPCGVFIVEELVIGVRELLGAPVLADLAREDPATTGLQLLDAP